MIDDDGVVEGAKTKVSTGTTPDKTGLVETRIYIYPSGVRTGNVPTKKTRTRTLSADKKTLTIVDDIEATSGELYTMMLAYERQ
jgi:hypothetical protein